MASSQQKKIRGEYFGKKLKAKKVIELYQAGERNFQGVKLLGQSFEKQDFTNAIFTNAELYSTSFNNSTLVGCNFSFVKCGIVWYRKMLQVLVSLITTIFFSICSIILAVVELVLLNLEWSSIDEKFPNLLSYNITTHSLIVIITFYFSFSILRKGLYESLYLVQWSTTVLIITFVIFVFFLVAISTPLLYMSDYIFDLIISLFLLLFILVLLILPSILFTVTLQSVLIALVTSITNKIIGAIAACLGFIYVVLLLNNEILVPKDYLAAGKATEFTLLATTVVVVLAGVYNGLSCIENKNKDIWLHLLAKFSSAKGGTSFYNSDLTEANFFNAKLISTDFRKSNLTRVYWHGARMLDRILPGNTYLKDAQLIQWLIGKGANNDFNAKDLRGVNLQKANLSEASFINSDLSNANLSMATLTGACLQDWNINSETKLDNVICDYVYLKSGQRERRPSNQSRNFKPGEFVKLVDKSLNTVDLIFRKGVNWKAVAYSLKNTQVLNEDIPLTIRSIENKGDGVVLIKVTVTQNADKGKIEGDFWRGYEFANKTLKEQYEARLLDRDGEINRLFTIVTKGKEVQKLMAEQPKNKQIFKGNVYGVAGNVEGNQNIYTSDTKVNLTDVASSLEKLLEYFEQNDPPTTTAQQVVKTATENQPEILDAEIVQEAINSSPTLKQRLGAAGTAGYIEIVKMLVPPVGVAIEAYKAFKNPES